MGNPTGTLGQQPQQFGNLRDILKRKQSQRRFGQLLPSTSNPGLVGGPNFTPPGLKNQQPQRTPPAGSDTVNRGAVQRFAQLPQGQPQQGQLRQALGNLSPRPQLQTDPRVQALQRFSRPNVPSSSGGGRDPFTTNRSPQTNKPGQRFTDKSRRAR